MRQKPIRNVTDATTESDATRTRRQGDSLAQELGDPSTADRPLTPEERLAACRAAKALQTGRVTPLTLDEIREGLE